MSDSLIVLPRPGAAKAEPTREPIPAPSEAEFVAAFGQLLPAASFLQTPNGKAAYYTIGPASAPPADAKSPISRVLFVHGVQTCAIGLQPLASALSTRFPHATCVLVDNWGHGLTEAPFQAYEASLVHSLLEDLMVHLGWDDAHLVGYSFGAATTASFTAAKPERVASFALVAPAGFIPKSILTEEQLGYLRGGEGVEEKAKDWVVEFLEGGQLVVPQDWKERVARGEIVAEAVRDWQMKNHKGHPASVVGIIRDGGVFENDASFVKAVKTGKKNMCVLGELDNLSSVQDLYNAGVENVSVVPQAGHSVVRDSAREVADLIEEFWKKL